MVKVSMTFRTASVSNALYNIIQVSNIGPSWPACLFCFVVFFVCFFLCFFLPGLYNLNNKAPAFKGELSYECFYFSRSLS